ncbi:uncharacterized protein VP01_8623g2, partial [Puccinia sorghi]
RASQWFEPYLDLLKNQSPSCLINNWDRFEQQFFTFFWDPNEVCNTEFELNSLSMKDNGRASTYITQASKLNHRPACSYWSTTQNASTIDQSNHQTQQLLS